MLLKVLLVIIFLIPSLSFAGKEEDLTVMMLQERQARLEAQIQLLTEYHKNTAEDLKKAQALKLNADEKEKRAKEAEKKEEVKE